MSRLGLSSFGWVRPLSVASAVVLMAAVSAPACGGSDASSPAGGAAGASPDGGGSGGSDASTGGTGGSSGSAGTSGSSGSGGSGGSGAVAGTGGSGGGSTCAADTDCAALVPPTTPSDCAEGYCDTGTAACRFRAKDKDGDGHRSASCTSLDGTSVETGDDCADTDKTVYPGAWDGPADATNPDSCDGVDEDCNNVVDDGVTAGGKSCFCAPGDTVTCAEDAGGHPIQFPTLDQNGKPLGACALGKKTCGANGKYGSCIGAIGPETVDRCDGQDENCNGLVDMDDTIPPINQITFTFDGDNDNYANVNDPAQAKTTSCPSDTPTTCPSYLDTTRFPCDPPNQWKTVALPLKDCDDNNPNAFPGAPEACNGVDNDCNGTADDPYAADASDWYFDYDGDNTGDLDVPGEHQCYAPTTLPAGCATLQANLPASYCTGLAQEGSAPACPPPACAASMWKKKIPQTDCKDRPDEDNPTGGYKANLVHSGGKDLCNGHDYDCDGTPDTGCGCAPIGDSRACGDAQTCNAGTQTCDTGGVWGACSGGNPAARSDYCPDADSDGYCDLTKCQTSVCPQDAAKDSTLKLKALCQPITDCNDKNAAIHPQNAELCNGDGKDYNCNLIPNTPGLADCQCVAGTSGIACAPTGYIYPGGKNPGDPLSGICQWGTQSCNPDGTLTTCTGGVSGYAIEQCAAPLNGQDYDCNGVANTMQCNCTNGAVKSCENSTLCNKGCTQTCANGQWGPVSVPSTPQLTDCYPDADRDGTCGVGATAKCPPGTWGNDPNVECSTDCKQNDATRNWRRGRNCIGNGVAADCSDGNAAIRPYFSQADSTSCGTGSTSWTQINNNSVEKCGDGISSDCYGGDNDGYDVGASCSGGTGSCAYSGSKVCNGAGSTSTVCSASAGSPSSTYITTQRNASYDNDCNGWIEYQDNFLHTATGSVRTASQQLTTLQCLYGTFNPCGNAPYNDGVHFWWIAGYCGSLAHADPIEYPNPPDALQSGSSYAGIFKDAYGYQGSPQCGAKLVIVECYNGSLSGPAIAYQGCR